MWLLKGTEKQQTWQGLAWLSAYPSDATSPSLDLLRKCKREGNAADLTEKKIQTIIDPSFTADFNCMHSLISSEWLGRPQGEGMRLFLLCNEFSLEQVLILLPLS